MVVLKNVDYQFPLTRMEVEVEYCEGNIQFVPFVSASFDPEEYIKINKFRTIKFRTKIFRTVYFRTISFACQTNSL